MPFTVKKIRRVNPPKKKARKAKRATKAKRKNPLLTLGNPRKAMKKARKKTASKPRRKNPFKRKSSRRNPPSPSKLIGRSYSLIRAGVMALVGLLITRQLPQLVLGARNVGFVGTIANGITAIAAGAAISKFVGKMDGAAATIGGGLYTVQRVIDERTPLGKALQLTGIGDPVAAGSLRGVQETMQVMPQQRNYDGSWYIPREIVAASRPVPAAGMGCADGYRFA